MEISEISGLWNNIKKYNKILTTFHLQHFFQKVSIFHERVQILKNIDMPQQLPTAEANFEH